MSKKLLPLLALAFSLLIPGPTFAHVLIKDQLGGTGAILHVNPDDDPVAGEAASLFFDIQDSSVASSNSKPQLTITDQGGETVVAAANWQGSGVVAGYIFPRQGLYSIQLEITDGDTITHTFLHSQRVSRGIMGFEADSSVPAWAQAGMVFTIVASAGTAIVAFNRRQIIKQYSKF